MFVEIQCVNCLSVCVIAIVSVDCCFSVARLFLIVVFICISVIFWSLFYFPAQLSLHNFQFGILASYLGGYGGNAQRDLKSQFDYTSFETLPTNSSG